MSFAVTYKYLLTHAGFKIQFPNWFVYIQTDLSNVQAFFFTYLIPRMAQTVGAAK